MTRPRAVLAAAAASLALLVAGCSASTDPAPSPSEATAAPPSSSPESLAYDEVAINCLNVLSPELRDAILGMADVRATAVRQHAGAGIVPPSGAQGFTSVERALSCTFASPEASPSTGILTVLMSEFDVAETQSATDALLAEVDATARVDDVPGIDGGTMVQRGAPDDESISIVVPGRRFDIGGAPDVAAHVAVVPDPDFDGEAFRAALGPVGPGCDSVLPIHAQTGTDASGEGYVLTDDFGLGTEPLGCLGFTAAGAHERALWWEDATADDRASLLERAAAGDAGLRMLGTTDDGEGTILASAAEVLVAFDASIVHLALPVDAGTALTIARAVHAPAWLDVPPVA